MSERLDGSTRQSRRKWPWRWLTCGFPLWKGTKSAMDTEKLDNVTIIPRENPNSNSKTVGLSDSIPLGAALRCDPRLLHESQILSPGDEPHGRTSFRLPRRLRGISEAQEGVIRERLRMQRKLRALEKFRTSCIDLMEVAMAALLEHSPRNDRCTCAYAGSVEDKVLTGRSQDLPQDPVSVGVEGLADPSPTSKPH